jgi:hypothetical protein
LEGCGLFQYQQRFISNHQYHRQNTSTTHSSHWRWIDNRFNSTEG